MLSKENDKTKMELDAEFLGREVKRLKIECEQVSETLRQFGVLVGGFQAQSKFWMRELQNTIDDGRKTHEELDRLFKNLGLEKLEIIKEIASLISEGVIDEE